VPILYWFFDLAVMHTDLYALLWNFTLYCLCCPLFLANINHKTNIPVLVEAIRMLTAFHALGASVVGLFGRKDQKFKVTDKGTTRTCMFVC
jgi:cellulose synthase (UDP-forming)